jgi:hypothetical protein
VIGVTFGDLSEEDQRRIKLEMRHEMEEIEAVRMRETLACYQKMRGASCRRRTPPRHQHPRLVHNPCHLKNSRV